MIIESKVHEDLTDILCVIYLPNDIAERVYIWGNEIVKKLDFMIVVIRSRNLSMVLAISLERNHQSLVHWWAKTRHTIVIFMIKVY